MPSRARFTHRAAPARWAGRMLALGLIAAQAACSTLHYEVNPPLAEARSTPGYALQRLGTVDNSDGLTILLALSGGGYRAAAMAYAALEVLRDTTIRWDGHSRSLLQEVDIISAVSGGSLTAAYYAVDPERFFAEFRPRVLDVDLQSDLVWAWVSPAGLWRLTSDTFGRGDLLQELLDEQFFHGRTFGALSRRRPMVYINATDMRTGERFEFTQDRFDYLCSDLDRLPIARAVAASMAVPIVFSPITVWSHAADCPLALQFHPVSGAATRSRYIHLVDGGLSDNTGVRTALENVSLGGGMVATLQRSRLSGARKFVQIVINAQVNVDQPEDSLPATPGLMRQLRTAIDVPIDRQAASSLQLFGEAVRRWQEDLRASAELAAQAADFRIIELSVSAAQDTRSAEAIQRIATGLRITPQQIELIRAFVRHELAANVEWQRLLAELHGTTTQEAPQ
jgi:NTE family protein